MGELDDRANFVIEADYEQVVDGELLIARLAEICEVFECPVFITRMLLTSQVIVHELSRELDLKVHVRRLGALLHLLSDRLDLISEHLP